MGEAGGREDQQGCQRSTRTAAGRCTELVVPFTARSRRRMYGLAARTTRKRMQRRCCLCARELRDLPLWRRRSRNVPYKVGRCTESSFSFPHSFRAREARSALVAKPWNLPSRNKVSLALVLARQHAIVAITNRSTTPFDTNYDEKATRHRNIHITTSNSVKAEN